MENIKNDLIKRMEGAIKALYHDLKGLRTGRASPNFLDSYLSRPTSVWILQCSQ